MEADEDDRSPGDERAVNGVGRLDDEPFLDVAWPDGRGPGHLEVVAGVVTERRADQPLEGPGIRRGRLHMRGAATTRGERPADAREVSSRERRAVGIEAVPGVAGQVREAGLWALGQATGEPRHRDERLSASPPADPAADRTDPADRADPTDPPAADTADPPAETSAEPPNRGSRRRPGKPGVTPRSPPGRPRRGAGRARDPDRAGLPASRGRAARGRPSPRRWRATSA